MDDGRKTATGGSAARAYSSDQRSDQARRTRQRILGSAHAEFLVSGYAGTTIAAIAARAGVSRPTVEKAFGTKSQLLELVIDVAIAGDDEPVAVLDRAPAARAAAADTVDELLLLIAGVLADGQQRSARLILVAQEAAGTDAALRDLVERRLRHRASTAEWIVDQMTRRTPLRDDLDPSDAGDTVWLLMEPALFCRLVEDRGWSPARYQTWFADTVQRLLLPPGR